MKKEHLLSALWIFLTLNFIFCDVFTLMYSVELKKILTGQMGEITITQEFLLAFALMMEIPMLMILLSWIQKPKLNRILNIAFGMLLFLVQSGSLLADTNSLHYLFFSSVELGTLAVIMGIAIAWKPARAELNPIAQG
ncbi:MAG TPA: hypothetical protein DCE41_29405 [Cytophagales bacterium]|nr:hypothetical protein [Cytophagales bacterium]HAA17413.1 hypothetical protein [Cytophagales bacterium]HAP58564.1 hypothetical protein [Cytophagales bacterium]